MLPVATDARPLRKEGFAEECQSPVTRMLVNYVRGLAAKNDGRALVSDVELMDLYKIADTLIVRDVIDDGTDYQVRYWGSSLTAALGFDATNMRTSGLSPVEMRDSIKARFDETTSTGRSWVVSGTLRYVPNKQYKAFEVVHLPLWDENGKVVQIISVYDWNFPSDTDEDTHSR